MGRVAIFIDGGCLEHVQKLAVDLVLLATKRQITRAVIVTGDSDFLPAIQAAKNEGVLIHLYHGLGEHRAHRDLWDAVDTQTAMTQELFKSLGARFLGYATLPGCSYHGEKETPLSGRRAGDAITGGVNKAIISITHEAVNRPSADSRERVVAYVDGFNLYFGLRQKGWRRYYWLSPRALVLNLLKPGQRLVRTKYFTARITPTGGGHEKVKRQATFLEALETLPDTSIYYGHYLPKPQQCFTCGATWTSHEEKMTDVNIAVELLKDAYDDAFDTAMILSADSDLVAPVVAVRQRFPGKRLVVACPPARQSKRLEATAHAYFRIGRKKIQDSQFHDEVMKPDGYVLRRPPTWR